MSWPKRNFKRNKFNAVKTIVDGRVFPSKLEAACFDFLRLMPDVERVEQHPTIHLTKAQISYKADYKIFYKDGTFAYGEAKGDEGDRFRLIKKLWRFYGPCNLIILKGDFKRPYIYKVIVPEKDNIDETSSDNN